MVAIHLSVIRCVLHLSSVFSSWSVFIGTSPSFDRAVSWLVRVYVLTATPGCSVCWFTDFLAEGMCSVMLHCSAYKGRHFHCKSRLISIVGTVQVLQGTEDSATCPSCFETPGFYLYPSVSWWKETHLTKNEIYQMRNQQVEYFCYSLD